MTEKARNLKPAVLVVVLAAIAAAFGVYLKGEGDGKVGPTAAVTTAAPQGAVTKALSTGTMHVAAELGGGGERLVGRVLEMSIVVLGDEKNSHLRSLPLP